MSKQLRRAPVLLRALVLAGVIAIACASAALAGAPLKGATYKGKTAHEGDSIRLKVSSNGRTVTVYVPSPPYYCVGGAGPTLEKPRAAAISAGGTFKGAIAYEFTLLHKIFVRLYLNGKFSGRLVTGTARTEFPYSKQCNGSTTFSARAK